MRGIFRFVFDAACAYVCVCVPRLCAHRCQFTRASLLFDDSSVENRIYVLNVYRDIHICIYIFGSRALIIDGTHTHTHTIAIV